MSDPRAYPAPALRRYLLGQLAEEEMERIDREILAEADALAALDSAEDDLIEDYLDGSLGAAERAAFEEHFLASPSHRQSLELARMIRERLQAEAAPVAPRARRAVGPWLGALAALLLIALWLMRPWAEKGPRVVDRGGHQGGTVSSSPAVPSPAETTNAPSPPLTPPPLRVATVGLPMNRAMAADSTRHLVNLDPGVEQVRLEVVLDGHEAYRDLSARLEGAGGALVQQWKNVRPTLVVPLTVPAQRLRPGPYTLILAGRDRDGGAAELSRWELVVDKR